MDTDTICVVCVYLATKISENKEWQRKLVATLLHSRVVHVPFFD